MEIASYAKNPETIGRGLESFSLRKRLFSEIRKLEKKNKTKKLLEIGCGRGMLLSQLNKKFPELELSGLNLNKYHGIKSRGDFVVNAKEKGILLTDKNKLPRIHFGNATRLPFKNNNFDIVISQVTFVHVRNKAKAIEEAYRVIKPTGIALISIGGYSIRRKQGYAMPEFFKKLNNKLKNDYNPRILIQKESRFLKLSSYIKLLRSKGYKINLWQKKFISKTQKGRTYWLILKKENNDNINLDLRYDKLASTKMNKNYANKNPINWGWIDMYKIK